MTLFSGSRSSVVYIAPFDALHYEKSDSAGVLYASPAEAACQSPGIEV